jgi:hypothetical protein
MHAPILTSTEMEQMIDLWRENMPSCYNFFMDLLGYSKKLRLTRSIGLRKHYAQRSFYLFMSISCMRYNHLFTHWGDVISISNMCRGVKKVSCAIINYFGAATSYQTAIRSLKVARDNYPIISKEILQASPLPLIIFDNGQRTFKNTFQRKGQSSRMLNVTVQVTRDMYIFR